MQHYSAKTIAKTLSIVRMPRLWAYAHFYPGIAWDELLTAALGSLRDHLKRDDPIFVLRVVARNGIQRLAIRPTKSDTDDVTRRGDQPQILAVGSNHVHAAVGRDIQAAGRVEGAAIAAESPALQLRELALVGERAIFLDVKFRDRRAIGDKKMLFIGA